MYYCDIMSINNNAKHVKGTEGQNGALVSIATTVPLEQGLRFERPGNA